MQDKFESIIPHALLDTSEHSVDAQHLDASQHNAQSRSLVPEKPLVASEPLASRLFFAPEPIAEFEALDISPPVIASEIATIPAPFTISILPNETSFFSQRQKLIENTQWGNKNGVAALIPGQRCGYPLGVIRSRSNKEQIDVGDMLLQKDGGREHIKHGFGDFVFDHLQRLIGLTFSRKLNPHGHDGIADVLSSRGCSGDKTRMACIVGGRIAYLNSQYVSTEWSGHYGHLWTDNIREEFQFTFYQVTRQPIKHIRWISECSLSEQDKDIASATNPQYVGKLFVSNRYGLFAANKEAVSAIHDATQLKETICEQVASYLDI